MSHTKFSLYIDIFSFAVDRSWHFKKVALVENEQKMGENDFFKNPYLSARSFDLRNKIVFGKVFRIRINMST
jgi:hypothetical protein